MYKKIDLFNFKLLLIAFELLIILSCKTTEGFIKVLTGDDIIMQSATELASRTNDKTIGISDIYLLGTEEISNFSIYLSNNLSGKLLNLGFTIADRDHLKQLETKWKFQFSYSDEDTTVQIAKLNGISALVVGTCTVDNKYAYIQLKLIDTQSGLLLGTSASKFKGDFNRYGGITSPGEFYLDNVVSGSSTSDPDDKKQYAIAYERIKIFPVASKQPNALEFI